MYWTLGPLLRFFFRVRIEGLENIPDDGSGIMVSNHVSFCDSIFLPLVLKPRIPCLAKA